MEIKKLIKKDENLYLEYKHSGIVSMVKPNIREWGEFLKDFVALINCNIDYVKETKYLIFGIDESKTDIKERVIHTELKLGKSYIDLKNKILEKLDEYFRIEESHNEIYSNFDIKYDEIQNKKIIVFIIRPSKGILILKKDLQDKKRTEKKNNVFIRKYKEDKPNEPEVSNASPEEIKKLSSSILKNKKDIEKQEKQEKSIEKTISLYVKANSMFTLNNPIKEKNWNTNIIYELYPLKSSIINLDLIFIHEKTSQKKTFEYLLQSKKIQKNTKRFILIENKPKNDSKIKNNFNADKVYSTDEFALEMLYKDYLDETIYHDGNFKQQQQIENFVEPFTANMNNKGALMILSEWFDTIYQPLMVIKGYGGIGKTTLIKYFLDEIYHRNEKSKINSKILFINSKDIITEISKKEQIDNIFDFYEVLAKERKLSKRFDKELLELSVDNGNLIIVIDGIDEVIAKLGNEFHVENFIKTIYDNYLLGKAKSKIILTCRDYFWDKSVQSNHDIKTIELKAFDKKLTKEFFSKQFDKSSKEFKRCIELSKEFALSNENSSNQNENYIPYILDVIMDMVKQKKELGNINKDDIKSKILNISLTNDYFIGRICNREIKKLNNLDIDSQIVFFINLSVLFNGVANKTSKARLFRGISNQDKNLIEKFKGHPIIIYKNDTFCFRYDFFESYFKTLYVNNFFKKIDNLEQYSKNKKLLYSELDDDLKDILINNIGYNNNFTKIVSSRLQYNDDLEFFIENLIENLIENIEKKENLNERKLISSFIILFLMCLKNSDKKNDTASRTLAIINIFGKNLEYLSLINLFEEREKANYPIFDFRDKKIRNVWFEHYSYFWDCKFNNNTTFENCTFKYLKPRNERITIPNTKNFFKECNIDEYTSKFIQKKHNNSYNKKEKLIKEIKNILRKFEQNGTFKERKVDEIRGKCDTKILDILLKNKVIHPYRNSKKPRMEQYKISDEYYDLIKILEQSDTTIELEKILNMFKL